MKLVYQDMPSIPLWHAAQFYGVDSRITWPADKDIINWQTYSFRWAKREIPVQGEKGHEFKGTHPGLRRALGGGHVPVRLLRLQLH